MVEPTGLGARAFARVRKRWRAWLRALHRDAGYLAIGLTFIYALSGIAINHIEDWNPNFETVSQTHQVAVPIPSDERAAIDHVLRELDIHSTPSDAYLATDEQLEIYFNKRSLVVDTTTGKVFEEYENPRFFVRVANWLHYNRGKSAWTYIADGYAAFLLFLAVSGAFMLKGRLGLRGRGALLVTAGVLVPVLYVHFSGGPGG